MSSVFLGGMVGSGMGMLLVCYLIYRGLKTTPWKSLVAQALISGMVTLFVLPAPQRDIDLAAQWAGWALALIIMSLVTLRKKPIKSP